MNWMIEVRFSAGLWLFLIATAFILSLGPTQLPIQWVLGVKRPEFEGHHSRPSGVYAKTHRAIFPHPICHNGVALNYEQGQISFAYFTEIEMRG
jgi:hypothetical protein